MISTVTTFLSAHSNTIVRTLGVTTMFGSAAHFVYAEKQGAGKNESDATKVKSLALHDVILALGLMLTAATLTTGNKMGTKTRVFLLACSGLAALHPINTAVTAYLTQKNDKKSAE